MTGPKLYTIHPETCEVTLPLEIEAAQNKMAIYQHDTGLGVCPHCRSKNLEVREVDVPPTLYDGIKTVLGAGLGCILTGLGFRGGPQTVGLAAGNLEKKAQALHCNACHHEERI